MHLMRSRPRRYPSRPRPAHLVEPFESRRLLSAAPGLPDLLANSDTGVSDADAITAANNGTNGTPLVFTVPGTVSGAFVTLYRNGLRVGSATAAGPETVVRVQPGLSVNDGEYLFTARQAEPGQAESAESPPLEVIVDTAAPPAPPAPDLDASSDTGRSDSDDLTNDNTPTLKATGAPYFRVRRDGVTLVGPYASGPTVTLPRLGDGTQTYTLQAVDAAGNSSQAGPPLTFTVDTLPPQVEATASALPRHGDPAYSFDVRISDARGVDVASLDGADFRVTGGGGFDEPATLVNVRTVVGDAGNGFGPREVIATYRVTAPGGAWDGADVGLYAVILQPEQVRDAAANAAPAGRRREFRAGFPTRPSAPDLDAPSDSGIFADDDLTNLDNAAPDRALRFVVAGTFAGATVTVYDGSAPVGSAVASGTTTVVTTDGSTPLSPGTHKFIARQAHPDYPAPPESQTTLVTVDTEAPPRPPAPDLLPASDSGVSDSDDLTNDNTPTLAVGVPATDYFRVCEGGGLTSTSFATGETFTPASLADARHDFTVVAVDAAGNASAASDATSVTVDTAAPGAGWAAGSVNRSFHFSPPPNPFGATEYARSVVALPDGKAVLGLERFGMGLFDVVVKRVNADGSPDTSFGTNGETTLPRGGSHGDIAVQPDGHIIVSGGRWLARLSPDGLFDDGFGTAGFTDVTSVVTDLTTDAQGRIVLTGYDTEVDGWALWVQRLNPNGSRDATFGNAGRAALPIPQVGLGPSYRVAVAPNGGVVVVGDFPLASGTADDVAVVRFNTNGTLDRGFGNGGLVRTHLLEWAVGRSVIVKPDGNLLVSGEAGTAGEQTHSFVLRYRPDGSLDGNFGSGGVSLVPGLIGAADMVELPTGDLIMERTVPGGPNQRYAAVARFDADGRFDPIFGNEGTGPSPAGGGTNYASALAATPDGDVLLGGYHSMPTYGVQPMLVRFHGTSVGVPELDAASDSGASLYDGVTNDATPTFGSLGTPPGPGAYFRLYRNGERVGGAFEPARAYTAPPQPDGTWLYAASWVDAAGNESERVAGDTVTIDTTGPRVEGAFAAGSSWSPSMFQQIRQSGLGTVGFGILSDSAGGTTPLPWLRLDQIKVGLSEPVLAVGKQDMRVTGVNVVEYPVDSFTYDPGARLATWTFGRTVPADKLLVSLSDVITDLAGNRLDGDSAGGPGGAFRLRLDVLPGDVNRSGSVNAADYLRVRSRLLARPGGATGASPGYSPICDVNADGRVNALDVAAVRAALFSQLPADDPTAPAPEATAATVLLLNGRDRRELM